MIRDTLFLIAELAVLFLTVAFMVHLFQRRLGEERLRRWMGGRPSISALKGIGVGFITPFCTYSAIPMLVGMRRAGVPPAGYVAFIVAAPVLDPVLFGALVLIVGLRAAILYAAVAFGAAMTLALIAQRADIERFLKPVSGMAHANSSRLPELVGASVSPGVPGQGQDASCGTPEPRGWRGLLAESSEAAMSALILLKALGPILILGVGIGLAIELLVPAEVVASIAGDESPLAIPIAAGLGTPLYFSTELFVPIADSLASVGVGFGAIVALTIAGAGANLPEFVILSRLARPRLLGIFIVYVFAVAVTGGFLTQLLI
jgi:uncharacterized membrane protein YraQ (UPF0718 family)